MSETAILIPVRESEEGEVVEVLTSELPDEAGEIIDILMAEIAPLELWIKFAVEYYKQGKIDAFKEILEEGAAPEVAEKPEYVNASKERETIQIILAAYHIAVGQGETNEEKRAKTFELADKYLSESARVVDSSEGFFVGIGCLSMAKGEFKEAKNHFKEALDQCKDCIPAILGKACVAYHNKEYSTALKLYASAIEMNPECPANVRLGLAQCLYKLGDLPTATQAFERVLELDAQNVEALVALATLEMNSDKTATIENGMRLLKRAYDINPLNANVLNRMATHFLLRQDYVKVLMVAKNAYSLSTVGEIRGEASYHMARAYHAQVGSRQSIQAPAFACAMLP